MGRQFVFGYGSLAGGLARVSGREPDDAGGLSFVPGRELHDAGFVADLPGFARGWGVAMDNRRDLPGYKYYTAPGGSRPAVFVAFLDVTEADGSAAVNGLCLPVDGAELGRLDHRERNYARVDVSDRIDAGGARVWVYTGTAAARERLRRGRDEGRAVIAMTYLSGVERAFAALGARELDLCRPSLSVGELPVVELVRHELKVGPNAG